MPHPGREHSRMVVFSCWGVFIAEKVVRKDIMENENITRIYCGKRGEFSCTGKRRYDMIQITRKDPAGSVWRFRHQ